ncbi:molybdate ABC transporter substrate-binding protein [Spirochaeta cellobiosiphila]|uniref:molybdate ABC transporter substrate-binding protein n=1 Tax=Spirochaeta cellobiosiphila TaxID=504483 RepID=UPI00041B3192|nr:molybdate ABC transporter substrate-binding protein [Spirochaeta cellobiosiphila]
MYKKQKEVLVTIMFLACFSVFAGGSKEARTETQTKSIIVFNAASTTDIIEELAVLYQEKTGIEIKSNPASSGTLAKQMENGAEVDVYISASKKWMDYALSLDVMAESDSFVKNRLVLIAPENSEVSEVSLEKGTDFPSLFTGYLSMGDPEHVPAGKYALEALTNYNWYTQVKDRILPGADVRAALRVVELGEADFGIVYETDAKKSEDVKIVGYFPEDSHTPVTYFCGYLKDRSEAAKGFYTFLMESEAASAVYAKYGFSK